MEDVKNRSTPESKYASLAILVTGILVLVVHHFYVFGGYFGSDDMHYARLSFRLLQGEIDFGDHYSYRWPVLALTALSYWLFGVSDLATALPTLLLSAGVLVLVYRFFETKPYQLALAFLLCFSVKWFVFYSDKIVPDVYITFFLFWAWRVYLRIDRKQLLANSLLFATLLFLAFLAKGTAMLILPVLAYYFLMDLRRGEVYKWKYAIPVGIGLMIAYLLFCYGLTGNPLARFDAIQANMYFSECAYDQMPWSETWKRITSGFLTFIWEESLAYFLILGIAIRLFAIGKVKDQDVVRRLNFYLGTIIVLFLSMNLMTFSLKAYSPGCLDIRQYLFAIPIMAVCIVEMLGYLNLPRMAWGALILLGLIAFYPVIKHKQLSKTFHYAEVKADVVEIGQLLKRNDDIILSNRVMNNLIDYYSTFELTDRLYAPEDFDYTECKDNCYLLTNWYTEYFSRLTVPEIEEATEEYKLKAIDSSIYLVNTNGIFVHRVVEVE